MRLKVKVLTFFAVIIVLSLSVKTIYQRSVDRFFPLMYEEIIEKYAKEEGLSKLLVTAVINAESGFDKDAHSGVAKGLMQITDETAKWISQKLEMKYSEDMAYDPETNIKMGCWYLGFLKDRYKNTDTALAAYNAGLGNVDRWLSDRRYSSDGKTLRNIPFGETKNYVLRVKKMMGIYQKLY